MKPLWFVEKDAFGWTINCRFMLGGKRAGVAHVITPIRYNNAADQHAYVSAVIRGLTDRRQSFIFEEIAHAHASN